MLAARFLRYACRCSFFQKSFFIQCRIASMGHRTKRK